MNLTRSTIAIPETLPTQFPAFLSKAAQLPTLSFKPFSSTKTSPKIESKDTPIESQEKNQRKILLVEDLPNIFTHPPTLSSFQSALIRFISQVPREDMKAPLVIIISDALSRSSDDSLQNWRENVTSRTVIPAEVFRNPRCTEIRSAQFDFFSVVYNNLTDDMFIKI